MNRKIFQFALIGVLLFASSILAQEEVEGEVATTDADEPAPEIVIITTSASETPARNATTTRPSTTTRGPSPTPTTITSRPSTSTRRPSPSTTARPEPVPTPPEFPKNEGNWSVKGINSSCLLLRGALQIHVKRQAPLNDIVVNVPVSMEGVNITGDCGSDNQHLQLHWFSMNETDGTQLNNTLRFKFSKELDEQYGLRSVKYVYTEEHNGTSDTNSGTANLPGPFFLTTLQHSFHCKSRQNLEADGYFLQILTENLQFEAFRNDDLPSSDEFSEAEDCKADHRTSTGVILAIGVGIGLVIVACIALGTYLIKRCRRDGYQQLDNERQT